MRILNSAESFKTHYVARPDGFWAHAKAAGAGAAASGTVGGACVLTTGAAVAHASLWSLGSGLPWLGTFFAGKATAAGIAAALGVAGSAAFIVPVLAVGGGVAYMAYRNRAKESLQGGSGISAVARAFSQIAWLPMLAQAASCCAADPSAREEVRAWVQRKMCAWGYSEAYVRGVFDRAMASTPARLRADYARAMSRLESGQTDEFGVKPEDLPHVEVRAFADGFLEQFEAVAA